jgi:dethiobiotin synthetase
VHRYFVTGTDTDVGKTRVTAALALALQRAGRLPAVVKLVQTGLPVGEPGDAARAAAWSAVRGHEFARFAKPADPWSAARAQGAPEVRAYELVDALNAVDGALVAEGAGGIMVPLNADEHFGHVAARAGLAVVIAVGLRLGCLNHALLTVNLCRQLRLRVAGGVLVERWQPVEPAYRDDAVRVLQGKLPILGILPFEPNEAASVAAGAQLFASLVAQ